MHSDQLKPKSYLKLNKKYEFSEGEQFPLTIRQMGSGANKDKSPNFNLWHDLYLVYDLLNQILCTQKIDLLESIPAPFSRPSTTDGSEVGRETESAPPSAGRVWLNSPARRGLKQTDVFEYLIVYLFRIVWAI